MIDLNNNGVSDFKDVYNFVGNANTAIREKGIDIIGGLGKNIGSLVGGVVGNTLGGFGESLIKETFTNDEGGFNFGSIATLALIGGVAYLLLKK